MVAARRYIPGKSLERAAGQGPEERWVTSRQKVGHRQAPRRHDGGEGVCGAGRRQAIAVRTQRAGILTKFPLALLRKAAAAA